MANCVNIGTGPGLKEMMKYAEEATTSKGNIYYRIPFWLQINDSEEFIIHLEYPDDLSEFICRSMMGSGHPQIKKPKV